MYSTVLHLFRCDAKALPSWGDGGTEGEEWKRPHHEVAMAVTSCTVPTFRAPETPETVYP
eukprot:5678698-Amphidinium_carterae.1